MKLVGFIKEYNDGVEESRRMVDVLNSETSSIARVDEMINYLRQGHLLLAWMGYITDVRTGQLIAPDSYYTDGVWVWPSYLLYYLERYPKMTIDDDFVQYLIGKDFEFSIDSEFEKNKNIYEVELGRRL